MDYTTGTSLPNEMYLPMMLTLGVAFIFFIIGITCAWKLHTKAGMPGWHVLIPFFNLYMWLKIVKRPGWWLVLFLLPVPFLSIVMALIVSLDSAKAFGRSQMFGIFLLFLFPVGYLIMAFGKSKYQYGTNKPSTTPERTETKPAESSPISPQVEEKPEATAQTPAETPKT